MGGGGLWVGGRVMGGFGVVGGVCLCGEVCMIMGVWCGIFGCLVVMGWWWVLWVVFA